jgi:uncharacterized protein (TIGR02284 family)
MKQAHAVTIDDVVFALNTCIETCTDAERGYAVASADVRDIELKRLFHDRSRQRTEFTIALQAMIASLGASPENEGTFKGAAHRAWIEVRRATGRHDDNLIIEECKRGETASLDTFKRALDRAPLSDMPQSARDLVRAQIKAIESSLEDLERLLQPVG